MIDVTFASVEEAVRILYGVAHYTPVLTSCQLDALADARVFLKCENFQRVGGGFLTSLCLAAHALRPRMGIFACETAGALDATDSVKQNRIVPMPNANTLADGLRTSLGELALPILRRHVMGFFAVGEEEIVQAMQFAYERLMLVIEPSSVLVYLVDLVCLVCLVERN